MNLGFLIKVNYAEHLGAL